MKTIITVTNLTLIFAAAYGICFLSAYLFLGTAEMHEQLKAELPNSFFARSLMPLVLAAIFSSLLWLANWLVVFFTNAQNKSYPLKIAGIAFITCMITGLIGVANFFWY